MHKELAIDKAMVFRTQMGRVTLGGVIECTGLISDSECCSLDVRDKQDCRGCGAVGIIRRKNDGILLETSGKGKLIIKRAYRLIRKSRHDRMG